MWPRRQSALFWRFRRAVVSRDLNGKGFLLRYYNPDEVWFRLGPQQAAACF
jgi:hypothetical protein